ncbi:MAG: pilus assembly protein N-terminal domain-containing protein [Selenomonadaceae bacterium]|nr:pilus assembly protein N-terminal domain-containing protein [Selenomonadaceae bacterium]
MRKILLSILVLLAVTFSATLAYAAELVEIQEKTYHHQEMDSDIIRIAVGSGDIAKVTTISSKEFLIAGQAAGVTTIFVWTADNQRHEFTVQVLDAAKDEIGLARSIEEAIGLPDVHVRKVDKRILLTGTVKNQYEKNYAIQIARLYAESGSKASVNFGSTVNPQLSTQSSKTQTSNAILTNTDKVQDEGNVIDLLQMLNPTQIKIETQVIAIRAEDANDLGILYGNSSPSGSPGIFYFGESYSRGDSVTFRNNPLKWLANRRDSINMRISALVTNEKAKILSRPSIMTLSGEQATIQIGGEIPYTTYDENNRPRVEFKEYGIILQCKPIVDAQNNIVATVYTEVSNISGEYVGDNPIISTRRADSVVSLKSGSTMIIGGLMDSSERKVVNKIPLLGDIPIIGEFFKYSSKTKDKQELIILVTPYIVGEGDGSRAEMSDKMKEHYREGLKEKNSLNAVDVDEKTVD